MRRILAITALLAACSTESGSTEPGSTSSASDVTDTSTGGATTTGSATGTGPTTTETTTDEPQSSTSTTGSSETTSETGTGTTGTSETTGETGSTSSDTGSSTGEDTTGGDGVLGPAAMEAMDALEAAVAGVTYPSESDYPWVVVGFADAAPVSEANVKQVIAEVYVPHPGEDALADRAIEVRTLAQLIDPLTIPQDWWDDYNKMVAAQYTEIRAVLEASLVDIQVFRIGEKQGNVLQGAVDIYVLGATPDGDLVGMWTVSIET